MWMEMDIFFLFGDTLVVCLIKSPFVELSLKEVWLDVAGQYNKKMRANKQVRCVSQQAIMYCPSTDEHGRLPRHWLSIKKKKKNIMLNTKQNLFS